MGGEGEDHPQAFRLTLLATSKAMVLGHMLEAEWLYGSGNLLIDLCLNCRREVYVAPELGEIGGPAFDERCGVSER